MSNEIKHLVLSRQTVGSKHTYEPHFRKANRDLYGVVIAPLFEPERQSIREEIVIKNEPVATKAEVNSPRNQIASR